MEVTFLGHASFNIQYKGYNILIDPFDIDIEQVEPDFVIITHAHQDHIGNSLNIALKYNSMVISNFEITNWFENNGVTNIHGMNLGGKYIFPFGLLKMVPALHSSSFPDGTYGGNACGFICMLDDVCFYYAGDTGLSAEMKTIGATNKLDFAFLPMGDNYTMGIEDAIIASEFINCNKVIGMHFDTFPQIKIDKKKAIDSFKNAGKELILPEKDKTIKI